jgi:indolepyruvate decarboxylase
MTTETPEPFTVATYLVNRLAELGIEHLFNVAGSYCGGLLKTLPKAGKVRGVFTTNEQESGYAVDAYARVKGYGAVCGTYGVGMFSLLNAVAGAYVERCAVVVINGGPTDHQVAEEVNHGVLFLHSTGRLRTDYDIFRNVTVAADIIRRAEDAPRQIDAALEACVAQRRPVYIEINKELWDKPCAPPAGPLRPRMPETNPAALKEVVEDAFQRLQKAKYPVIWGGEELARWRLQRSFQALVEKSKLPYATTLPGKTILPETHPQFVGVYDGRFAPPETREIVGRADCILAFGTSICDFIGDLVAKDYELMVLAATNGVRIGYHLYRDVALGAFLDALTDRLASSKYEAPHRGEELSNRRSAARSEVTEKARKERPYSFDTVFARLEPFLQDKIVIGDTSLSLFASADVKLREQFSYTAQSTWMSIGYSVGAVIGAACATGKRVVAFAGDCGFHQGPQALSTLAHYKLPAVIFVISNRLLGIQQFLTDPKYYVDPKVQPDYFNVLPQWDYISLATAFGAAGARVTNMDELEKALKLVEQTKDKPCLVELVLDERDLPRSVRDALENPVPKRVQEDLEYPLLSRSAFKP